MQPALLLTDRTPFADELERDQLRRLERYRRLCSDIADAARRDEAGRRLEFQLRRRRPA